MNHHSGTSGEASRNVQPAGFAIRSNFVKIKSEQREHSCRVFVSYHPAALKESRVGNQHHDADKAGSPIEQAASDEIDQQEHQGRSDQVEDSALSQSPAEYLEEASEHHVIDGPK